VRTLYFLETGSFMTRFRFLEYLYNSPLVLFIETTHSVTSVAELSLSVNLNIPKKMLAISALVMVILI